MRYVASHLTTHSHWNSYQNIGLNSIHERGFGDIVLGAATISHRHRLGMGGPRANQVFGRMTPLIYGTSGMPKVRVDEEPVFDRAILTGHVALDLSLIPAALLAPFLRFGWTAIGPDL